MKTHLIIASLLLVVNCAKLPEDSVNQANTHNHKLSEESHYIDTDNDLKLEHNSDYDHEAFLGKEEAEKFKIFSPEVAREKLSEIVENKIDADHDGFVNQEEMHKWLKIKNRESIMREVDSRWQNFGLTDSISLDEYLKTYNTLENLDKIDKNHDNSVSENELRNWIRNQYKNSYQKDNDKKWNRLNTYKDDFITFDELIDNTIGKEEEWSDEEKQTRKDDYKTYLKLMERDKKRFKGADEDGDGKLSKNEFADFLHPEENKKMRDIVIDESLEDLDKNGDKVVSLEEFINEFNRDGVNYNEEEPDWLKQAKIDFKTLRDTNNDNVMDREEVANWILPPEYDHSLSEAKHLVYEADSNKDGKLSKEEILEHYRLFVASQATNHGQDLYENKDEL